MKRLFQLIEFYGIKNTIFAILIITLLSVLILITVNATANERKPKRPVTGSSGLSIRATPDVNGQKICVVPSGDTVEILETMPGEVTVGGKTGHWVKVKWKIVTGWAFDANLGEEISLLWEHFVAIGVEISTGDDSDVITKDPGEETIYGYCDATDKPVKVNDNSVIFEYCKYSQDEGERYYTRCTYFECAIDGDEIFATKKGRVLKTSAACTPVKTITGEWQ